jgi:sigma-B regulation protein RsbU (phosphoserine phosphatase)
LPGLDYARQRVQLDGGRLYLFTDGVTEGWAENGEMLELEGLKTLLDMHAGLAPVDQLARVAEALVRPGARLRDDLTLLVIG